MKRSPFFISVVLSVCFILASLSAAAQDNKHKKQTKNDAVFELENISLYINRAAVAEGAGTIGGTVVWFYVRDRGQFVFSSNPQEGFEFQKIGTVRGSMISFWYKDDLYEIFSTSQIVKDGSETDLWLLHDPNYRPKGCENVCFGSASPFDYFVKSR
ncbi:MAG TPA: hypothetical protein VKA70_01075 [Blastocatellia bacterium]|nr:hypothetical protein [Blastocatellia bacterium]